MVVRRLEPEWIAGEKTGALPLVPDRKRKHAAEARYKLRTARAIAIEDDFSIGMRSESRALAFQFLPQFPKVIDLAAEGDREAAVGAGHRLMTCGTRFDHRQPGMSECRGV